eukprot:g2192.t1
MDEHLLSAEPVEIDEPEIAEVSFRLCSRENALVFVPIYLATFAQALLISVIVPFFPVVAAEKWQISEDVVGLIFALFPGTLTLASPICVRLCGAIGRHNTMYVGFLVMIAGTISFAFGDTAWVFAASRSVQGLGAAGILVAGTAMLSAQFPTRTGAMMGMQGAVGGIGFMLGPLLGGFLYELGGGGGDGGGTNNNANINGTSGTADATGHDSMAGFRLPFFVVAGFSLLIFAPMPVLVRMAVWRGGPRFRIPKPDGHEQEALNTIRAIFNVHTMLATLGVVLGIMIPGFIDPTLAPQLGKTLGLREGAVGALFMLPAAAFALCGGLSGAGTDAGGSSKLLIAGSAVGCLGFLLLGPAWILEGAFPARADEPDTGVWVATVAGLMLLGAAAALLSVPAMPAMLQSVQDRLRAANGQSQAKNVRASV